MTGQLAGKAALELLSRMAALELGPRGITVNAVLRGATDTDLSALTIPHPKLSTH